jgi:holo-[acyl-carrier protein] synthase|tara:strand:+ start:216 stop:599 length:384 start_codon:yes stop_codon:yes gene_type:complete
MMLLGAGIDIVEVQRIKDIIDRRGDRFIEKILNTQELEELTSVTNIVAFVAKRFAVKEAAAKALGTGIGKQLSFTDMYVEHDELGKPLLKFTQECSARLNLKDKYSLLTIADERAYAVAHVLFFAKD